MGLSQEKLLRQLNPLIRGWACYYRHGASKRTFERLDHYVFWQLWRLAKGRHPDKSAAWKRRKYFSAIPGTFSVRLTKEQGTSYVMALYRAASTKIRRHIKTRADTNPYDSNSTCYFEKRGRKRTRRSQPAGNARTPQRHGPTRTVAHWLQFAAACPHSGAPVEEA